MHSLSGGLVLGYHGCDAAVGERLLAGDSFTISENDWDWLGSGAYFWGANPKRGYDFAAELKARKLRHNKVASPFVVGAVINLGLCLDLTTKAGIDIVRDAHTRIMQIYKAAEKTPPSNDQNLLKRNLDRAVIEQVHLVREEEGAPAIDTVRGVFIEGEALYPGAGFHEKTHVQLAVRNLDCVKGVFRVPKHLYE